MRSILLLSQNEYSNPRPPSQSELYANLWQKKLAVELTVFTVCKCKIFLTLIFYVKSISRILWSSKSGFFANFEFCKFRFSKIAKISQTKIQSLKKRKNGSVYINFRKHQIWFHVKSEWQKILKVPQCGFQIRSSFLPDES